MKPSIRYPLFDWLRLFLALEVACWHFLREPTQGRVFMFIPAVPAFLALSGFVVMQSWETSDDAWHFWWKRLLRIQPAMLVMLAVTAIAFGSAYAVGTIRTYFTFGMAPRVGNGVVWTLGCEEVAYALMALIYACDGYKRPWFIAALLAICAAIALSLDVHLEAAYRAVPGPRFFIQNYAELGVAFFTGNLIYLNREKLMALARRRWIISVTLLYPLAWNTFGYGHPATTFASLVSMPLVILWGLGGNAGRIPGDLSYGIYLLHVPVGRAALRVSRLFGTGSEGFLVALSLLLTVIAACGSWIFVERPCLKFKDKMPLRKKWR